MAIMSILMRYTLTLNAHDLGNKYGQFYAIFCIYQAGMVVNEKHFSIFIARLYVHVPPY